MSNVLTQESMRVRDLPHEERPPCKLHTWFLVELNQYRMVHRCRECLRYAKKEYTNITDEQGQQSLF